MTSNENILKLETRRQIYNIILENPGLHLRGLSRRTNLSFGGLRHHLNYLKKQEYIVTKSDPRYTRYYVSKKVGKKDKELLNLLRQEVPRKIVLLLITAGPAELYGKYTKEEQGDPSLRTIVHSKKDLVELTEYWKEPYADLFHLKKKRMTIDFHLKKLIDADVVEKIKDGREAKYVIKDEFRIWLFLADYQKSLSDELVDLKLFWHNDFIERRIDAVLNVTWEIFPHPYHA